MTTPSIQAQAQAREAAEKPKGIYLYCQYEKGNPRYDIKICKAKCKKKGKCEAYRNTTDPQLKIFEVKP